MTGKVDQGGGEHPHHNPQDTVWILLIGQFFLQGRTLGDSIVASSINGVKDRGELYLQIAK